MSTTSPTDSPVLAISEQEWSVTDSAELYGVARWGHGYVSIADHGHVQIRPGRRSKSRIDLGHLVDELRQRDLSTPLLLRFPGILEDRLAEIAGSFRRAILEFNYAGDYRGVYPIKVNQQRHVVEELLRYGKQFGFGLEAGSKPELLAVMALADDPDTLVICNGFKDAQFIEAVILSRKVGKNVIPRRRKVQRAQAHHRAGQETRRPPRHRRAHQARRRRVRPVAILRR